MVALERLRPADPKIEGLETCAEGELCAPCMSPLDGFDTGATEL